MSRSRPRPRVQNGPWFLAAGLGSACTAVRRHAPAGLRTPSGRRAGWPSGGCADATWRWAGVVTLPCVDRGTRAMTIRVLIVDDFAIVRQRLRTFVGLDPEFE